MAGVLCSMVGASFVTAVAEVIRRKKGITAVGNAQVDTAQSQFGGSSALFDGTGDRLDITAAADLAFGSSDFTIECWVRYSSVSGNQSIIDFRDTAANGAYILLGNNGGAVYLYVNGDYRIGNSGTQFATNTWYHVALSRSGTSTKLFINGTQSGSTYSDSNSYLGTSPDIGELNSSFGLTGFGTIGHIDEFRISNNARYTANFTAPTAPFVNDANTLLLLHMDGTDAVTFFEDDNGVRAPKAIRRLANGSVSLAQSKFGGGSLDLSGTTNTTALRGAYATDLSVGTGDFTIETWVRFTGTEASNGFNQIFGQWANPYVTLFYVQGTIGSGGQSMVLQLNNAVTSSTATTTGLFTTNVWYHIAVTRSSGTIRFFKDGTQVATTSNATNTQNLTGASDFGIGYNVGADTQKLVGFLEELRVSNNARYTANFTAPTAPFVNDANTLLLLHMDGTSGSTVFRDDNGVGRAQKGIAAVGNAQIDTAQSQFSGASALFDGTGDYLIVTDIASGITDDQTFEFWIRFANLPGSGAFRMVAGDGGGARYLGLLNDGGTYRWEVSFSDGQYVERFTTSVSTNTWYHVALTKSGSTLKMYQAGSALTSAVSFNTMSSEKTLFVAGENYIGSWNNSSNFLNGWMDEIRVSNSVRYTTGFTPSTTPFQNDANTVLLIHCDGTDASTVFIDDNGTRPT